MQKDAYCHQHDNDGHSDELATANRISYYAIPEDAETISHG
jgi:hypothetical protein